MCACTEPDGTGVGAVYVECGVQTSTKPMLNYTNTYTGLVLHLQPGGGFVCSSIVRVSPTSSGISWGVPWEKLIQANLPSYDS